ncbi:MAG: glycosyl hydrolase [Acidobacteriota bacterium]
MTFLRSAPSLRGARLTCALIACQLGALPTFAADEEETGEPLLAGIEYRSVGPSRGGRSTTVTGVVQHPQTFYMGTTGGGVWKTTSAGARWENISDGFFGVGSIGAVAVAPTDPNVIYVGSGSGAPRGNISIGDGMYRSTDAGKTWSHIGLDRAGLIPRVAVHPEDPETVWVAALGQIFGPNEERGVYKSSDGGETWRAVLQVSDQTGAVDLVVDPSNPRNVFAAVWTVERKPWTLIDGGEESGIYKSTDGGESWTRLEADLPEGPLGRIGLSLTAAKPGRLYALVSAPEKKGALFRSDDYGESFEVVSRYRDLLTRGWYYSQVHASPTNADVVFVSNAGFFKSIDGGRNFESIRTPHGDHHDLWINPEHPEIMVQGNDGGGTVTLDGAKTWSTQNNQPTAEFYRVSVDHQYPYRLYGAQQDNSTISVPSRRLPGLTPTQHWYAVAGAESGHIAVHPENPDLVFAGNYLGRIDRLDRSTGHSRNMILYPEMQDGTAPRDLHYRFQWNAPILLSKHDYDVLYHASNYVHLSRDGGFTWRTSPIDLTRNDPEKQELPGGPIQYDHTGVEVYNTVFALAEGTEPGVVWAGSDGGMVHLSRDWTENWQDVTPKSLPIDSTINQIEASVHEPGRAYLAVHRYRMDDFAPYILVTENYGRTWRSLTSGDNGIPEDFPVRAIREDSVNENLLFAGTEFGMFWSTDRGASWRPLQLNLPVTPITDLAVHRDDLIVATQGRSFWILDDLEHLRQVASEPTAEMHLFEPATVVRAHDAGFRGGPSRATVRFLLPEGAEETASLEIVSPAGEVLRRWTGVGEDEKPSGDSAEVDWTERFESGLNSIEWNLQQPGPRIVDGAIMSLSYTGGMPVVPGDYRVVLKNGEETREATLVVAVDPRLEEGVSIADLEAQQALMIQVRDRLSEVHDVIAAIRSARAQLGDVSGLADSEDPELEEVRTTMIADLDEVEETLIQTRNEVGQDPINFPPKIDNQFAYLYSHLMGDYGAPTEGARERFADLESEVEPLLTSARSILGEQLESFNERLVSAGLGGVRLPN